MSGGRVALTAVGDDPPDAVLRKAPLRIQRRITLELDACFTVKVLLIQLPASQESEPPFHLDGRFRGNDRDGARVWWLRQSESVCATNLSSPVPSRGNRIWSPRTRAAPEPYSLCCGRGSRGLRSAPAKPDAASPIVTS